jgi:vacuolar-type H+-ATPase catalytic subunit A/Vma1
MHANPNPGARKVGGATPHPRDALAADGPSEWDPVTLPTSMPSPTGAARATMAWTANEVITQQVSAAFALADVVRRHAHAMRDAGGGLPEGPLRAALAASVRAQVDFANSATAAASRYGRRFGHLAFAFPPVG